MTSSGMGKLYACSIKRDPKTVNCSSKFRWSPSCPFHTRAICPPSQADISWFRVFSKSGNQKSDTFLGHNKGSFSHSKDKKSIGRGLEANFVIVMAFALGLPVIVDKFISMRILEFTKNKKRIADESINAFMLQLFNGLSRCKVYEELRALFNVDHSIVGKLRNFSFFNSRIHDLLLENEQSFDSISHQIGQIREIIHNGWTVPRMGLLHGPTS
jgi:hypothetical protein